MLTAPVPARVSAPAPRFSYLGRIRCQGGKNPSRRVPIVDRGTEANVMDSSLSGS